jgi:hypothetical protein
MKKIKLKAKKQQQYQAVKIQGAKPRYDADVLIASLDPLSVS